MCRLERDYGWPLRGVLGAGGKGWPSALACPATPAPRASVPVWCCRSCCCCSCRIASSRRLLRLADISSGSVVCWLMTCSTTSPSPEKNKQHMNIKSMRGYWLSGNSFHFLLVATYPNCGTRCSSAMFSRPGTRRWYLKEVENKRFIKI